MELVHNLKCIYYLNKFSVFQAINDLSSIPALLERYNGTVPSDYVEVDMHHENEQNIQQYFTLITTKEQKARSLRSSLETCNRVSEQAVDCKPKCYVVCH